jgi:hypothetical protein
MINEVGIGAPDKWTLCLQWGRYIHENGKIEQGYRFIWRDEKKRLHPQRGQACIESLDIAQALIDKARKAGWGDYKGGYI